MTPILLSFFLPFFFLSFFVFFYPLVLSVEGYCRTYLVKLSGAHTFDRSLNE
jgi:hypothetical protein